ncbi:MAG: FeoB-associated Cys-rich membrane protein [Prevotella sp.]|nr:FeoB-associated Cys-rich membrane protein [Prevotella sp.]
MAESIIVGTVLTTAIAYAGWRVYRAFHRRYDPCAGCAGCQLKELQRQAKERKACTQRRRKTENLS